MLNVSAHMKEHKEVKAAAKQHNGHTWLSVSDANSEFCIFLTPQGAAAMADALNDAIQMMDSVLVDRYIPATEVAQQNT